ncbi:phosphoribosylanthranilate isomerase [Aquirufa beregesia]
MKWKVCGMREMDNIQEVAKAKPDYMGFIWAEASPRYVGEDFVIPQAVLGKTIAVGVFVNRAVTSIIDLSQRAGFTWVQLHGEEKDEEILALKKAGLTVIKAISVADKQDVEGLGLAPDFYLFDTKKGKQTGGTGQRFDWDILAAYTVGKPFILAGGLSKENVVEAIELSKKYPIYALDFNSKVEIKAGLKDVQKVREISEILAEN